MGRFFILSILCCLLFACGKEDTIEQGNDPSAMTSILGEWALVKVRYEDCDDLNFNINADYPAVPCVEGMINCRSTVYTINEDNTYSERRITTNEQGEISIQTRTDYNYTLDGNKLMVLNDNQVVVLDMTIEYNETEMSWSGIDPQAFEGCQIFIGFSRL